MKIDRQEVIGLVVGIQRWFSMNHEDRFASYDRKFDVIEAALTPLLSVRETNVVRVPRHPGVTLHATLDTEALGKSAQQVIEELRDGRPSIRVLRANDDTLNINVHTLNDGEEHVVAERLVAVLR